MLDRQPCGSEAVAKGEQRMMTDEINQGHQLTRTPQLVPPFGSLSELDAYQMEQMIKCYSAILSNRQLQDAPPARTSRLQQPLDTPKTEPAGEHCFPHDLKTGNNSNLIKEQVDHNKRRKIEETISVVTAVPYDEKLWRKYGQKNISGAKQPRSYFRCSYWREKGCQAKKTVQQDDKDEAKYHVVYTKPHTCSVAVRHHTLPNYLPTASPPEIFMSSNDSGKCFRSSFVDIAGEHLICPPPADEAKPTTGDKQLMQEKVFLSSQVAPPVLTPGTLEMTNNDEMLGFLPTLESVELDDDYLRTMIDELFMSGIYT